MPVPVEFRMPKLGLTMEEGTIIKWLASDGDRVEAGAAVVIVETDKVETDIQCPGAGILHRVGIEGVTYPCGDLVAWLLQEGEAPPASSAGPSLAPAASPEPVAHSTGSGPAAAAPLPFERHPSPPAPAGRILSSPNARRVAAAAGIAVHQVPGSGPGGRIVSEDVEEYLARHPGGATGHPAPPAAPARHSSGHVVAGFAARSLADLLGVDIAAVPASSRDGKISREDVAAHVRRLLSEASSGAMPVAPPLQEATSVVPLTGMRGTVARRMHSSLRDMAQLTLTMDADMNAVVADRRARAESASGVRPPGFTDYVVAAAGRALRAHPMVNSQILDSGIALLPRVHVGVAVAAEKGLYVPVVHDADQLSLTELAAETFRLAEAARAGALRREDLDGATFSVSALGMFGVESFTPIINPPNAAILGVGRIRDEAVWDEEGRLARARRLTLSLTWDHRVLDGAPAAEFAQTVVRILQEPSAL